MLTAELTTRPTIKKEAGSALLEGLIAILIFSLGILAIVGLQANSMRISTQSKMRMDASYFASQRIGEMWLDKDNLSNYVESNTPVTSLPEGKRTTAITGDQATVTVTWQVPGDSNTYSYTTTAKINWN